MDQAKDFTKEFAAQRAKFRPWAITALAVIFAIIFVLPILFLAFALDKSFIAFYLIVCAVVLFLAIPNLIKSSGCPSCNKFMGRDISKFCPSCGAKIRE